MTGGIGVPKVMAMVMPLMPMWSELKAVAPTVTNDPAFVEEYLKGRPLPDDRWTSVTMPTLLLLSGKSPA